MNNGKNLDREGASQDDVIQGRKLLKSGAGA